MFEATDYACCGRINDCNYLSLSRNETYLNIGSKTFVCRKFDSLKFDFHLEPFKAFVRERKKLADCSTNID